MPKSFFQDPFALGAFALEVLVFAAIAFAETRPRHTPAAATSDPSPPRLLANFGLGITNSILALLLPFSTVTTAELARQNHLGLLNHVAMPWLAGFLLLVALRTLAAYLFHRASHAVPLLWRFHRIHHTDRAFDLSTAFRSHPVEVLMVAPIAIAVGLVSGASVRTVIAADMLLLLVGMWEHGALTVPPWLTRTLGWVVATPEQHRVHHNRERAHHDRNFGDTLILWDRLFGTYVDPAPIPRDFGLADANHRDTYLGQLMSPLASPQAPTP